MNSLIRINTIVNKSSSGNPDINCENILESIKNQPNADITVLPALALMPPSSNMLFKQRVLIEKCKKALYEIIEFAKDKTGFLICGLPVIDCGKIVSAIAVAYDGKLLGLIPDFNDYDSLNSSFSNKFMPFDSVFQCGNMRFCIASCNSCDMLSTSSMLARVGCSMMIFPTYHPVIAGSSQDIFDVSRVISKQFNVATVVVNGGVGDTSSPSVYEGLISIFECGKNLTLKNNCEKPISFCCDIDCDITMQNNNTEGAVQSCFFGEPVSKEKIAKTISKYPFVPRDDFSKNVYLDELFELQVAGLYARLVNTGIKHAVLGVSGGLDSTLALMVAVCAFDKAGIKRENLWCITMPGFGTSDRTYYNALGLMESLGVSREDISIKAAVLQHFEDINHNPNDKNVTYENAQARERTQILFDISNEINGFVIGTGDLSENALGFCTFGGDSIASYNVNICIPKTVVRFLVERLAKTQKIIGTENFLNDVLQTPVSPELLPSDENGEIAQKTEEILGSYDLHDFFLYNFVKYGFSVEKLFNYAVTAFENEFTRFEIKTRLKIFMKRFYRSQFKRTCAPDCADITEINLSNGKWQIPCDLNIDNILAEIDEINV